VYHQLIQNQISSFVSTFHRFSHIIRRFQKSGGAGTGTFVISIDPDNKINEFYKDNNLYSVPFYVKGDTSRPNLAVTIDGTDILDGDFVSSNPKIIISISDLFLARLKAGHEDVEY